MDVSVINYSVILYSERFFKFSLQKVSKYGPEISRYLDTFHAVSIIFITLQTFSLNYLYQTQEMSMKEFSFIKF